jgi:hypothetical protein
VLSDTVNLLGEQPLLLVRECVLVGDSVFEYDVFLSFSVVDEEAVRSIWQQLTLSGLRVFWSDSSLRERAGSSWFEVIQDALSRSRHLILVCTQASLASKWVRREYVAFFNHQYSPPTRLFIPVLGAGVHIADLPLFLKEIEAVPMSESDALQRLIRVLGGVDIESLKADLARRNEELVLLRQECAHLRMELSETRRPSTSNQDSRWPTVEHNAGSVSERAKTETSRTSPSSGERWAGQATGVPPPLRLLEDAVIRYFRGIMARPEDRSRAIAIIVVIIIALIALANSSR